MTGRTIAIGDIHGCSLALDTLLETIQPQADDLLVALGDYVDRGPDSAGVIDRLLALGTRCRLVPLLGNHELMMLAALQSSDGFYYWLQCGGSSTLESYQCGLTELPPAHVAFIKGCRRYYETDRQIFVHANYDPDLPLDEQPDRLLFWEHLTFLPNGMHTIPARHFTGKVAFVGHTPQTNGEILDLGDVICLDTFCVGDGYLTAMEVNTRQIWQADRAGRLRGR